MNVRHGYKAPLLGAALAIAIAFAGSAASAAVSDKDAVLAANAQFYVALNKMLAGDAAPIEAVWSHAADVTYMGPTGLFDHGWAAVRKDWDGQAKMKLGGKVEPVGAQAIVGSDLAVVTDYEEGQTKDAKGKLQPVKLRATNTYRKEGGAWKMVGHHTDTLPYLVK